MADVLVASWTLVTPVKRLALAKSRLADAYPQHRPDLALAFAVDTVSAALASPLVSDMIVVTDDSAVSAAVTAAGARVVADPGGDLNDALAYGASLADTGVAAISADLPALRSSELTVALAACGTGRSFVVDTPGTGTTLLAASPGVALNPLFGVGSAAAHRASGAIPIDRDDIESVRRDVDTAADLAQAIRLGVGPHTAEVMSLVLGGATGSEGLAC